MKNASPSPSFIPLLYLEPRVLPPALVDHRVLYASSAGATTPLHYDLADGLLCQTGGEKTVWLFPPEARDARKKMFGRFDFNGNGYLSLAEVDKAIRDELNQPQLFSSKPVLMRAFQAAKGSGAARRMALKKEVVWHDELTILSTERTRHVQLGPRACCVQSPRSSVENQLPRRSVRER